MGFREMSRTTTRIGDGPIRNPEGKAVVQTLVSGVETQYAIQAQPTDIEREEEEEEEAAEERDDPIVREDLFVDEDFVPAFLDDSNVKDYVNEE